MSDWIDVNDRMPEEHTRVFIAIGVKLHVPGTWGTGYWTGKRWRESGMCRFSDYGLGKITHWMPLLNPPEFNPHNAPKEKN